jgi:magnesium chelatase family protein
MAVARAHAVALLGLAGTIVDIEADISGQLPGFTIIGLPDTALGQARERVRAAASNAGCPIPSRKVTVNLSPAALPKQGSAFDLGIAMAVLAAAGLVPGESVDRVVHLGELTLDGRLRPTPGVLPSVLAASRAGVSTVLVPAGNAAEARLVQGVEVVGVASLRDAAIWHGAPLDPVEVEALVPATPAVPPEVSGDLADVLGNRDAVDALVVAAAGAHHVFFLGPPGAGKTMLASRLPAILPDLDPEAALEVGSLRSLSGLPLGDRLVIRPPFEAPHHTASAVSIVGGGSGVLRPGAAARAAHGVLFLDEAPEFSPHALDALRQPIESGVITISRAIGSARFPARFQLVLAANPCPCGNASSPDAECVCTPFVRRRYLGRISGPLLDRVDIRMRVERVTAAQLRLASETSPLDTARARTRVEQARASARARLAGTPWHSNADVAGTWLRTPAGLPVRGALAGLDRAMERGSISMRGRDRVLRIAWTLADLDGASRPDADHVGRALYLRRAV